MLRPFFPMLAALLLLSAPVSAQEVTDYDRFQLWNDCGPMQLLVEGLSKDAADIGLTKEAIETTVRSRLRTARIYNSSAEPYLYVTVNVARSAYGITIDRRTPSAKGACFRSGVAAD